MKYGMQNIKTHLNLVAPLAGAWIEITIFKHFEGAHVVAPLAGAWIEIFIAQLLMVRLMCRSPRGSVD